MTTELQLWKDEILMKILRELRLHVIFMRDDEVIWRNAITYYTKHNKISDHRRDRLIKMVEKYEDMLLGK